MKIVMFITFYWVVYNITLIMYNFPQGMPSTSNQQEQLQYHHHQLLQQMHLQKYHPLQQLQAEMESNNIRQQPAGQNFYNAIIAVINDTAQNPLSRRINPSQFYFQPYNVHPNANNLTHKPSSEPHQNVLPPNHPLYYQQPQRVRQSSTAGQSPKLQRPPNLPPLHRAQQNSRLYKPPGHANQPTNSVQFQLSQLQYGNQPSFPTEPPQSEHQTLPSLPLIQHVRRPPVSVQPTNQAPIQHVQQPPSLQLQFANKSAPPYPQSRQHQSVIQSPTSSTTQKLPGQQMNDRYPVLRGLLLHRPNKPAPKPKPTNTILREEQGTVETIQQPSTSQQNVPKPLKSSPQNRQNIPQSPILRSIPQPLTPYINPEPLNLRNIPQSIPETPNAQIILQNIPQTLSLSHNVPEPVTPASKNTSYSPEKNILPLSPTSEHISFPIQYSDPRKRLSRSPLCSRRLVDLRFSPCNHEAWSQYKNLGHPREKNRTVALNSASNLPSWAQPMRRTFPASQQYEPSYVPPLQSLARQTN